MDLPDVQLNTSDDGRTVVVMAVLILLIGAGLAAYGVDEYQTNRETLDNVVEVDATIVESEVRAHREGSSTEAVGPDDDDGEITYRLSVEFEYDYEGETYRSSKFDLADSNEEYDSRPAAERALEEYPEGEQVTAYVDPDRPDEAFLDDGMPTRTYGILGFGVFLVLGSFVMIGYHTWRKRTQSE